MVKTFNILRVPLACLLVFLAYRFFFRSSEETIIREMLAEIESVIQVPRNEPIFDRLAKAKKISSFFTDSISYRLPEGYNEARELRTILRKELQQRIVAARSQLSFLEIKLEIEKVKLEGGTATVQGVVDALGAMPGHEGQFFDRHRGTILLRKVDGEWLIEAVLHEENLRN